MKCKIFLLLFFLFCLSQNKILAQHPKDSIMIMNDNLYLITSGKLSFTVNPLVGGRITSFKLGDYEFLTGKDIDPNGYGSTFWPAPQSIWNWPPIPALDKEPYSAVDNGSSIKLTSMQDPKTGFQFVKKFSAGKNSSINLRYSIINKSSETKKVAPWEITRTVKGGLLFFPMGKGELGVKYFEPAHVDIIDGIAWYKDDINRPKNNHLSRADGSEGWLAYAVNNKLFIKNFKDIKTESIAPGEGEILFYIGSEADFIEVEVEGEYKSLKPGEESLWNMKWIARDIPSSINIEKGNDKLVNFVRKIVQNQ
jgi:hypothetical protein